MTVESREDLEALIRGLAEYRKTGNRNLAKLKSEERIQLRDYLAATEEKDRRNAVDKSQ